MKLLLVRKKFLADRTLGELYVEGIGWYCDTLEPHCIDWSKEKKVKGKTAIPEGENRMVEQAWPHGSVASERATLRWHTNTYGQCAETFGWMYLGGH